MTFPRIPVVGPERRDALRKLQSVLADDFRATAISTQIQNKCNIDVDTLCLFIDGHRDYFHALIDEAADEAKAWTRGDGDAG